MKKLLCLLVFLVLIATGLACQENYLPTNNVTILDVIEPAGINSSCAINIYNSTGIVQTGNMSQTNLLYSYDAGMLPNGLYSASIVCTQNVTQFVGECKFTVSAGDDNMLLGAIVLLPMLLAFLMIVGAVTLDNEKHAALKIGLFLLSMLPFIVSVNYGVIALNYLYTMPALIENMSGTVFWFALIFFVLLFYFMIYAFYAIMEHIAQKKKEKLQY